MTPPARRRDATPTPSGASTAPAIRTRSPTAVRTAGRRPRPRSPAASRRARSSSPALANLAIAVAKLIGGLISHSSAMLSEAAHSVADTVTEVFLFVALKRGQKPPDEKHPFGYGRETYFWAFIASLATFLRRRRLLVLPGHHDDHRAQAGGRPDDLLHRARGVVRPRGHLASSRRSGRCAARPASGASRRAGYLTRTTDTTVKAVTFEDAAALVGLVLAALGLFLEQMTGDPLWDGVAAIAIGLLLLVVAFVLARANMSLLIGQSASPRIEQELKAEIAAMEHVDGVPLLLTSVIGPGQDPGRGQGGLRRHLHRGRHRADRRRGGAAPRRAARGRAVRLPRPHAPATAGPGPRPTGPDEAGQLTLRNA